MSGHSATIDPAVDAVRDDLADVELADRVFAPHYARALPGRLITATILHAKPAADAEQVADLRAGTAIDLFDISGGWAWVRSVSGIGYVPAETIAVP